MTDLVLATMAGTTNAARQALLWARSIRTFSGRFANAPIWLMVPEQIERLPTSLRIELDRSKVRLLAFKVSSAQRDFPFATKTIAAGTAEFLAQDRAALLAWMDRDSLVLQEPNPLLLADKEVLGYRPVDHALIGSLASQPPDSFWSLVYNYCGVDPGQLRSMATTVDEKKIHPYFNAGMLVVRPRRKLLQSWSEDFTRLYALPVFTAFYKRDMLYRLFFHQAILSGTILAQTDHTERLELSHLINYPLHMHPTYPSPRRAARLNDIVTCRYDTLVEEAHWEQIIAIGEPLRSWLQTQRAELGMI